MSTNQRIRGRTLQNIRKYAMSSSPLCMGGQFSNGTPFNCASGRFTIWSQRDHIQPIAKGGQDTEANVQYLCDACHTLKTAHDMGHEYRAKVVIGTDGWPK